MDVLRLGKYILPLGEKTLIMGILNVTPDSFSDGGEFFSPQSAVDRAVEIQNEGADIIDIGACSTAPQSEIASEEEELSRLLPVLEGLKGKLGIPVSVDTFRVNAAKAALENGASLINDVSGSFNPEIAQLAKERKAGYAVTHNPESSAKECVYENGITPAIREFFLDCIGKAAELKFPLDSLILDPGIGFSKSREDDLEVIRNAEWFVMRPCSLLFGASRKRVTGLDGTEPCERDFATAAANTAAIRGGTDIVRVHNVKAAKQACGMADLLFRNE